MLLHCHIVFQCLGSTLALVFFNRQTMANFFSLCCLVGKTCICYVSISSACLLATLAALDPKTGSDSFGNRRSTFVSCLTAREMFTSVIHSYWVSLCRVCNEQMKRPRRLWKRRVQRTHRQNRTTSTAQTHPDPTLHSGPQVRACLWMELPTGFGLLRGGCCCSDGAEVQRRFYSVKLRDTLNQLENTFVDISGPGAPSEVGHHQLRFGWSLPPQLRGTEAHLPLSSSA